MQVITGHLTATEKSHIKAIFKAGLTAGKVNRTQYVITQTEGIFTVLITKMQTAWCEVSPRLITNKHTFKI